MKKSIQKAFLFGTVWAALVPLAVGCAPSKREIEISGVATIDGEPIDLGIVQFSNGTAEGGGNVQEGKYTAKVPSGELTVRIRGYRYAGPMPEIPTPKPGDPPTPPPQRPREESTVRALWENPTMKITVDKKGVYDLNFETPQE